MTDAQQRPLLEQNREQYRVLSQNTGKAEFVANETIEEIRSRHSQQRKGSGGSQREIRTYSLSNRGTIDFQKLVDQAVEKSSNPIKLSFTNVCFEVEVKTTAAEKAKTGMSFKRQQIVKGASGYAAPGQTTYIMGSSGAGKTSLLNILADRVSLRNKAKISGQIVFNDCVPVNTTTFSRYGAYVMQDDILFSHFTVQEALTFAARLKLKESEEDQDSLVRDIIRDLGLYHIKESQIGDVHRKVLSGGERKRTSIGVELISQPSLILLDEPTSGLDAFKARSICKLLNDLSREKGMTVISTIHSPSSDAFYYFDRLILMSDGFIAYQGDAAESMDYFKSLKFQVPRFANPADFFMKVLSIKYPKQEDDEKKLEHLTNSYRFLLEKKIATENSLIKLEPPIGFDSEFNFKAPVGVQLRQLLDRAWLLAQREPRLFRAKILQNIIMCLFMLPVFWGLNKYETQEEVLSFMGAIYFMAIQQVQLWYQPTVIVFQDEKPVFIRERASGMYEVWVYAMTKWIAEIPTSLVVPLLYNCIMYFSVGFNDIFTEFFQVYIIMALMVQSSTAIGYFLSSVFNHATTAVAFAPIFNQPLNLLGGWMINLDSINGLPQTLLSWLQWISPVKYGFNGIAAAQFTKKFAELEPTTATILEDTGLHLSYMECVAGLCIVFTFFRFMVIVSLTVQDMKWSFGASGDTRNMGADKPLPPKRSNQARKD